MITFDTSKGKQAFQPPTAKFFDLRSQVQSSVSFEVFMRLAAAQKIVSHLVSNTSLPAGDYKVIFEPEEGGKFMAIHPTFTARDNVGFKIFEGTGGLRVGEIRHKLPTSKIDSELKSLGGQTFEPIPLNYAQMDDALDKLSRTKARISISERDSPRASDLGAMHEIALKEKHLQNSLLFESCGNNPPKKAMMDGLLSEMGEITAAIQKNLHDAKSAPIEVPSELPAKAALLWPVTDLQAGKLALHMQNKAEFCEWIGKYIAELKKTVGVDLLEYSSSDTMLEIELLLQRLSRHFPNGASFESKYSTFTSKLRDINYQIESLDSRLEKLVSKASYSPEDFMAVSEIAMKRTDILRRLQDCYQLADYFHHAEYNKGHIKLQLATMAANLCKVSGREVELWKELSANKCFKEAAAACLGSLQAKLSKFSFSRNRGTGGMFKKDRAEIKREIETIKDLDKTIKAFLSACTKETGTLQALNERTKGVSRSKRMMAKELEYKFMEKLDALKEVSPLAYDVLKEAYAQSKSHQQYKRERLPSSDMRHYLNSPEMLLSLVQQQTPESQQKLSGQIKKLSGLFGIFEKYGLRDEILAYIGNFLYVKEKAFDIESDPVALNKAGYSGANIKASYWVSIDGDKGERVLNVRVGQTDLQVPMPAPMGYQESVLFANETTSEQLYGAKLDLDYFVPGASKEDSLPGLYAKIADAALSGPQHFREMQRKMRSKNLQTGHFLSTMAHKESLSGRVSNLLGDNPPLILSTENTFSQLLTERYPNFQQESAEAESFIRQKTAVLLFEELNRTMPYWIMRCAEKIAGQAGKK